MNKPQTVDAYIKAAPLPARSMLKAFRAIIKKTAPKAEEKISYGMPYYYYYGRLAYFGAFKNHVSYFAWGPVVKKFAREVEAYRTSTGTLQFPFDSKIPTLLITKLVKARMVLNLQQAKEKLR